MTKKTTLVTQPQSLKFFFSRYHAVIFFVSVVGALSAAVFLFYQVATSPSATSEPANTATSSFDEATIKKIRSLHKPGEAPVAPEFPAGRIDPFSG